LTNFLNYVECHNVFPEYGENIIAAKNLLQLAGVELVTNRSSNNVSQQQILIAQEMQQSPPRDVQQGLFSVLWRPLP